MWERKHGCGNVSWKYDEWDGHQAPGGCTCPWLTQCLSVFETLPLRPDHLLGWLPSTSFIKGGVRQFLDK